MCVRARLKAPARSQTLKLLLLRFCASATLQAPQTRLIQPPKPGLPPTRLQMADSNEQETKSKFRNVCSRGWGDSCAGGPEFRSPAITEKLDGGVEHPWRRLSCSQHCTSRRPEFNSQHLHSASLPPVTPVLEESAAEGDISVKCLLCKHKDLSWDSGTHMKSWAWWHTSTRESLWLTVHLAYWSTDRAKAPSHLPAAILLKLKFHWLEPILFIL